MNRPIVNINSQENKNNDKNNISNFDNMDKNNELIKQLRDNFNLSEEDYSNEKILNALEKHHYNFYDAFESLFQ